MLEFLMAVFLMVPGAMAELLEPPALFVHECGAPVQSEGEWQVDCKVTNSAPAAAARLTGLTLFKESDRTVPWAQLEFDVNVPGGIEPGETRALAIPHPDTSSAPADANPRTIITGLEGWALDGQSLSDLQRERKNARREAKGRRELEVKRRRAARLQAEMRAKHGWIGDTPPADTSPVATSGAPLTGAEQDAFRVAVQQCWNVDASSEAAHVTLTVAFDLDLQGRVQGDVRRISGEGGSEDAIEAAFQSARRAILRCQRDGYPLPTGKYEFWKTSQMTFDPSGMRMR